MGYSNVTGDLNVYSLTSTQNLTVRGDTVSYGNLTNSGTASFARMIAANLTVTGNFTVSATNTQVSNSLTINNAGTTTALLVNQNEFPDMSHNVAEFWDHTTLAMVIDPNGNVAVHLSASPGYALSVNNGALFDNVTVLPTGTYTGSGAGLTNVPVTGLYGAVGANQVQNTQTNVTTVGTLWTLNVYGVSNLNGSILGSLATPVQSNITTLGLLTNLAVSNALTVSNIVASGNLSVLTQTNLVSANVTTANITTANIVTDNVVNLNVSSGANITYLTVSTLANIVSSNTTTANIATANIVTDNVVNLNVSSGANITYLTVRTLANLVSSNTITANIATANVSTANISILNVNSGTNTTYLTVSTLANIVSANVSTANIANLNVNSGANITYLSVSTLANITSSNTVTANIGTANVSTANISILNVNSLTAFTLANLVSANTTTAAIATANVVSLNVSSGANTTYLTVSTLANITSSNTTTANIATANVTTANISILNVNSGTNTTYLTVSTLANLVSSNTVTANIGTANVSIANVTTLNVSSTANIITANILVANIANIYTTNIVGFIGSQWVGTIGGPLSYAQGNVAIGSSSNPGANLTVTGNIYASNALSTSNIFTSNLSVTVLANLVSANTVTANIGTANVVTANITTLNVSSTANIITANILVANIANIYTTNIVGFVGSQWAGTVGGPLSYASGNVAIGSSTNPGANLTVTGNVFVSNAITTANIFTTNVTATGTITGAWNGVNQGTLLTLATNLATGTAFATSTDLPTLQAYHVPLQSFTQNALQTVTSYTVTAQGLIKFNSTGLYQLTMVFVMDSPVAKVALGTNTTSAFPSSTSAYTYVYTVSAAASPSDSIVIPINVQNTANYYYIDVFCRSSTTSGTYYLTAGSSVAGSQNGTYMQLSPFGTYISTAQNAAAGILLTTTGSTYSSPLAQPSPLSSPSNTYHVTMTSGAGWSQTGSSSLVSVSANGNLQFLQAGVYNVTVCYNATNPRVVMQVGIGSSASDSSLPSTIGTYLFRYSPMYTSDPSPTLVLPLSVTDTTKFYYIDLTVDTSTSVTLQSTSTYVSVTPLSSYMPSPMATASIVVSQVVTAQSTSYTATSSDYYIGMSNGGTVTLPQGGTLTRGKMYTIKDESGLAGKNQTYNIIIQASGSDLIDGQSNVYVQLAYTAVNVMWTGANNRWVLI